MGQHLAWPLRFEQIDNVYCRTMNTNWLLIFNNKWKSSIYLSELAYPRITVDFFLLFVFEEQRCS